jgi:hypothetical protein
MISANVAPLFRWSRAITWAVLLPSRIALGFGSGVGDFLDRAALVADLASFGATTGDCTPTVATRSATSAAPRWTGLRGERPRVRLLGTHPAQYQR